MDRPAGPHTHAPAAGPRTGAPGATWDPPAEVEVPAGPQPAGETVTVAVFGLTSFAAAGLLFAVQPMVAKMLLPRLGGSAAVWNTAMVFFQAVLLAGYALAHLGAGRLGGRSHRVAQVLGAGAVIALLPIALPDGWTPPIGGSPSLWVLGTLAVMVGAPFLVLSTSSPTLQHWYVATGHRRAADPYFLYATGNAGSLLALVAYPFVIEPHLDLDDQARLWAAGYVVVVVLFAACAVLSRQATSAATAIERVAIATERITWGRRARWCFAAAVPSALLLGVTRHLTTDIASVPLLWVGPLALYLLSYIAAFGSRREAAQRAAAATLRPMALIVVIAMGPTHLPLAAQLAPHLLAFFAAAVLAHARLAADRPAPARLTEFYLWLSIGGVVGGAVTALVAPIVFPVVLEYPIAIALALLLLPDRNADRPPAAEGSAGARRLGTGVLVQAALYGGAVIALTVIARRGVDISVVALAMGGLALVAFLRARRAVVYAACVGAVLVPHVAATTAGELARERTFFGVYAVREEQGIRTLDSGTTSHGTQRVTATGLDTEPLSYYARTEGVGRLFTALPAEGPPRQVGVIGLGAGALASYGRAGDRFDFYEIDDAVVRIAQDPTLFTYLSSSPAETVMIVGDGRLELERRDDRYDVLVLDAFSSDAIPVHLLTDEAFALYRSRLDDGGVLAVHISNRWFDFVPVLARLATSQGLVGRVLETDVSTWVLLAPPGEDLSPVASYGAPLPEGRGRLWTDDFSDLLSALR
jgi:hypothetical protein